MSKNGILHALDELLENDSRYDREAYLFIKEALDFSIKQKRKLRHVEARHVSPSELIDGVRIYALREFGPMVPTVFSYWRIKSCADLGELVFNLIHAGILGKNEGDTIEDFQHGLDFQQAFVEPFLPTAKLSPRVSEKTDRPLA